MYKDPDKQREADRARQQRRRDVIKAKGVTNTGRDGQGVTRTAETVNPSYSVTLNPVKPKRGKDIKCFEDLPPDVQQTIDRLSVVDGKIDKTIKAKRTAAAIRYQHLFPHRYEPNHFVEVNNKVTGKPGDEDYNGICTPEWGVKRGR